MSQAKNMNFNPFEAWNQSSPEMMKDMQEQANKNMQTASSIGQMCAESMQAMAKRATDVAQRNAQTTMQGMKNSMNCKSFEEAQKTQAETWTNVNKECWSNAKEMTEMSTDLAKRCMDACDNMTQQNMQNWCNNSAKPAAKK